VRKSTLIHSDEKRSATKSPHPRFRIGFKRIVQRINNIDISEVQSHLQRMGSAVELPYSVIDYSACLVSLDDDDVRNLVLWFEFEKHTANSTCNVVDSLPQAAANERISRFIKGDSQQQLPPLDLRTSVAMEPVIVARALHSDFLYIIDGNHRVVAQQITGKGFRNAKAYVCMHREIDNWEYVPEHHKQRMGVGRRR
jgi:hypothetical protein